MANRELNRLKVVLAEKKKTNKWLGEQLGKDKFQKSEALRYGYRKRY